MSKPNTIRELESRVKQSPSHTIDGEPASLVEFFDWLEETYWPGQYTRVQREFIEEHMLQLGIADIRTYLLLCQMASKRRGVCWPSVRYLAKRLGVGERHLRRSTKKLQEEGLIQKGRYYDRDRNRQHNIYKITLLGPAPMEEAQDEIPEDLDEIPW